MRSVLRVPLTRQLAVKRCGKCTALITAAAILADGAVADHTQRIEAPLEGINNVQFFFYPTQLSALKPWALVVSFSID